MYVFVASRDIIDTITAFRVTLLCSEREKALYMRTAKDLHVNCNS